MFDLATLVQRIGTVSHFKNLSIYDLKNIVTAGQMLYFCESDRIIEEGAPCSGLYVLFVGEVNLVKCGPQGQETIMGVIKPVIMFNEVAVLDGGSNPVSVVAAKDCVTWQISMERFHKLMERYPSMGLSLLKVLAARNRQLISRCEDIAFRTVLARTAKLILELSDNGQKPISRREHSNQELAAKAATVAEPISRSINSLRQSGLIACDRRRITVCSAEGLAELAELNLDLFQN
jgi:CRP/FNR family transcriptional regulator, cyclic AMP receptor protein